MPRGQSKYKRRRKPVWYETPFRDYKKMQSKTMSRHKNDSYGVKDYEFDDTDRFYQFIERLCIGAMVLCWLGLIVFAFVWYFYGY